MCEKKNMSFFNDSFWHNRDVTKLEKIFFFSRLWWADGRSRAKELCWFWPTKFATFRENCYMPATSRVTDTFATSLCARYTTKKSCRDALGLNSTIAAPSLRQGSTCLSRKRSRGRNSAILSPHCTHLNCTITSHFSTLKIFRWTLFSEIKCFRSNQPVREDACACEKTPTFFFWSSSNLLVHFLEMTRRRMHHLEWRIMGGCNHLVQQNLYEMTEIWCDKIHNLNYQNKWVSTLRGILYLWWSNFSRSLEWYATRIHRPHDNVLDSAKQVYHAVSLSQNRVSSQLVEASLRFRYHLCAFLNQTRECELSNNDLIMSSRFGHLLTSLSRLDVQKWVHETTQYSPKLTNILFMTKFDESRLSYQKLKEI